VISRTARTYDIGFLIIRMNTRLHGNNRARTIPAVPGLRKR
jgi:hypothetical protein